MYNILNFKKRFIYLFSRRKAKSVYKTNYKAVAVHICTNQAISPICSKVILL